VSSASEPILRVEALHKRFGGVRALAGVDLVVERGEFRAIIGPNGAGKSTFFNTMTGLLRPDSGRVRFEGRDVTGELPHLLARKGVGRTFQITSVFQELTALENVQVSLLAHARQAWSMWPRAAVLHADRAHELLDLVGLGAAASRIAGTLAHGDQKRLELAIALAGEPRLLLLDEPTAGMAAQERLESIRLVHAVARQLRLSCVFTEHDMAVVFAVATKITVMHQGRVLAEGTPEEVRANRDVQQVYLGETTALQGAGA
jgi:ABC-type branched-subunit amino acid transport system ATPase component